jgi:NADP-dependent 3-hydroxy acid dehydrogenase YdfG
LYWDYSEWATPVFSSVKKELTMNDKLKVVITGASSGIGASLAELFMQAGAQVALTGRRKDRLDEAKAKLALLGLGSVYAYELDIVDSVATQRVLERFIDEIGGLDVLINNAGVGFRGPAMQASLTDWNAMLDVNLRGLMTITRLALPYLVKSVSGPRGVADIVSISSIAGRKVPGAVGSVYAATKHALGAFSEGLRQELAPQRVRVGLVEPGIVSTEMTTAGAQYAPDARTPKGLGVLQPVDVAKRCSTMVSQPQHVAVNELLIRPTEQVI